jgi:methylenetetrahydrofolate dehydrogenase (NADP+)/methenyltetrahydrofolate cyclohydrolase
MTAIVIDGTAIAAGLRAKVAAEVRRLARDHSLVPALAVVMVGHNPASEAYVGSKRKMMAEAGMHSFSTIGCRTRRARPICSA